MRTAQNAVTAQSISLCGGQDGCSQHQAVLAQVGPGVGVYVFLLLSFLVSSHPLSRGKNSHNNKKGTRAAERGWGCLCCDFGLVPGGTVW